MITLTTIPSGVLPVGNPIWLRGKTDNYQRLSGASQAYFFSSVAIADGDILVFTFNSNTYTLVFKTTPNPANPFEVPFDNITNTVTATHLSLVRCISQYYTITAPGAGGIYFVAKNIDAKWNISFDATSSSSKFSASLFNASYEAAKIAFKGFVELFKQTDQSVDTDESNLVAVIDADPHREGSGLAANEDWLDWEFQEDLASSILPLLPDIGTLAMNSEVMINYWLKYWESYGSPPVPSKMAKQGSAGSYLKALKARLPHHRTESNTLSNNLANFNLNYITPGTPSDRKFLTNTPNNKRTSVSALEFLSLYVNLTGDVYIEVKIYYENGTTSTLTKGTHTMTSDEINTVWCFETGFDQLELDAEATPDLIYKYEIRIMKTSGGVSAISETFTYILDRKNYLDECSLLFLGDLGNWDTARFIGTRSTAMEVESIDATKSRLQDYAITDPRFLKVKPITNRAITFNTGYKREEEAQWLNELGSSELVYLYEDNQFVPIFIDNKGGVSFGDKAADLFAGGFEGRIAAGV